MRLLLIRHGDPDYELDSLTEKGFREAAYLADYLEKESIDAYYVSSLGRAKETAKPTLEKKQATAKECVWLREFAPRIARPDMPDKDNICWDWLPEDWTKVPEFYDKNQWTNHETMQKGKVLQEYQWVCDNFDELLRSHGYERSGNIYKAVKPNNDTIALFCHFGSTCVILSHLLGISPMVLWHGFCSPPTGITTVCTEERRKGIASFRVQSYGETPHLYCNGEPISSSAKFRACYFNEDERVD